MRSKDAPGALTVGNKHSVSSTPGPHTLHEKRLPWTSSSATGSTAPAVQLRASLPPRRGHAATASHTSHAVPFQPAQQRPHEGSGVGDVARDTLFSRVHSSSSGRPQTHVAQLSFWTNLLPLGPRNAKSVASFAHGGAVSGTWMHAFETSCGVAAEAQMSEQSSIFDSSGIIFGPRLY